MKCCIVFGTRPEAIKMAPLVDQLRNDPAFSLTTIVTGQHREMLDQVLEIFAITPDIDLDIMTSARSLESVVSSILNELTRVFSEQKPDLVLVHGDTATTLAASLAAYFNKIKIAHVEAGLRTHNLLSPWPEEGNRKLVGALADLHFAPTIASRENLLNEGVPGEKIFVVGNTVIDALLKIVERVKIRDKLRPFFSENYPDINLEKRLILVTGHRRENFGDGLQNICDALLKVATQNADVQIIYPVHLNPKVRGPVSRMLSGVSNLHLIEPLDYELFVELMLRSYLILTDSGGIQEEAPSLDKPVLLMRDTTERPEGVHAGTVKVVGTSSDNIFTAVDNLLKNVNEYKSIADRENPYGDGKSAAKISSILRNLIQGL